MIMPIVLLRQTIACKKEVFFICNVILNSLNIFSNNITFVDNKIRTNEIS